jgi:hypothetical protein
LTAIANSHRPFAVGAHQCAFREHARQRHVSSTASQPSIEKVPGVPADILSSSAIRRS